MEKCESIENLAEEYTRIFQSEHGFACSVLNSEYITNFLIEFAGAVEHHLSSERAVEAGIAKPCTQCEWYKAGVPRYKFCPECGGNLRSA